MRKTEAYYFTISRSPRICRAWDGILARITQLNGYDKYLYLDRVFRDPDAPRRTLLRFIFLVTADRKHTPLNEDLAELKDIFGCAIELLPVKRRSAPREVWDALPTAIALMNGRDEIRGTSESRLVPETTQELLQQIDALVGFSSFKETCRRLSVLADRMSALGKRGNYNTVLIKDSGMNEFLFTDMLYSLLVSKQVITDPRIARGDLDDAVRTGTDTALLYYIMERWDFGRDERILWGTPRDDAFHILSRRRGVYITAMERAQYEKAKELDYFTSFFPNVIEIRDLEAGEKTELLKHAAQEYGFSFDLDSFQGSDILKLPYPALEAQLSSVIQTQLADPSCSDFLLRASDFDPLRAKCQNPSGAMEELERLIGLSSVKQCVREIVALLKNRGRGALPCLHMVFRGNPGTGKTTVARLIGRLFGELGVIRDGEKFIETDRDGLVSQYLGGTAAKTAAVVKDALGGVLFIDEAYALTSDAAYDYGHEAINTLVKRLEDHRKEFVCIMAGYTREMDRMLDSNPGLRDRIQFYIDFPDYSAGELVQIYCRYAEAENYRIDADARTELGQIAEKLVADRDPNFSNARLVRKIFERTRIKQALRTADNTICREDILAVFRQDDMNPLVTGRSSARTIGFLAG